MALSRVWTVEKFFKHAMAELRQDNPIAYAHRFEILNQVQSMVAEQFYNLIWESYMSPVILAIDTTGKYATAATSAYTSASRNLNIPTVTFASTDVGKLVMFRKTAAIYVAYIESFVDPTNVIIAGNLLPSGDLATIDEVLIATTAPTVNLVNISTLNMMRTSEQAKLQLMSSVTKNVFAVSAEEVQVFRTTAPQNSTRIVWAIVGEELIFAYGNGLTSLGTLTLRYPRIPNILVDDPNSIDLPDGIPTAIAMLLTKKIISERYGNTPQNYGQEMASLVNEIYRNAGMTIATEEIKSKVEALT